MSTPFADKVAEIGTAVHWWRMHATNVATEPDVGTDPDSPLTTAVDTAPTSRSAGPLLFQSPTYSATFTNGYLTRSALISSNDFGGSTTVGSFLIFFRTSYTADHQEIFGGHTTGEQWTWSIPSNGELANVNTFVSNTTVQRTTPNGYNDGNWHMWVVTCDGTNDNVQYVDGSPVAVYYTATARGKHPWINGQSNMPLHIGNDKEPSSGTYNKPFKGDLSELIFFSSALTASQVSQLWTARLATPRVGGKRYKGRKSFVGF